MVNFKPTTLKIVVSFVLGVVGGLIGFFPAWSKYTVYQKIPGLSNYFTLWETVVRDGFLSGIIIWFVVGIVVGYVGYSLVSKRE